MSGLSRTPGKRVWVNPHRGFESRPLRQLVRKIAAFGPLFFYFYHPSSYWLKSLRRPWVTSSGQRFSAAQTGCLCDGYLFQPCSQHSLVLYPLEQAKG